MGERRIASVRTTGPAWLALIALAIAFAGVLALRSPARATNLLLVTIDTLRADRLGAYGGDPRVSPRLDALARESLLFERAYATAPLTGPSHASILTGQHPSTHGIVFNGHRVPAPIAAGSVTLAEHLRDLGFATAAIVSGGPLDAEYGFARGFGDFQRIRTPGSPDHGGEGAAVTRAAIDWLRGRAEPWFLWVHYFEPHLPYLASPEIYRTLGARPVIVTWKNAARLPVADVRRSYGAEILETDRSVGALLDFLDEAGTTARTLVALTADHGDYLGEHGFYGHHGLYDGVLHVPLWFASPALGSPRRVSTPVSTIDLAPTVLDLLGLPPMSAVQGRSLVAADGATSRPVFAEYRHYALVEGESAALPADHLTSVRDGDHKYIRDMRVPGASRLFDTRVDPGELRDLSPLAPAVLAHMERTLDRHVAEIGADAATAPIEIDAEGRAMLRELGYGAAGGGTAERTLSPDR